MKDKTKEKIKKYTTAAGSTIAGEAVGLAMGELLSTDDMDFENPTQPSSHKTQQQLAEDSTQESKHTPFGQEEAENVKNDVEVIAVMPNTHNAEQHSYSEAEVVAVESNEDVNFSEQYGTLSDEESEVEAELAVEESTLADNQMNEEIQDFQNAEEEITVVEGDYETPQILPSTIIPEIHPLEGDTDAITSADSNGMPDYVNNANVDDYMA